MGMDVMGVDPVSERGAYFRRNIWGWHPLWTAVANIAPDIAQNVPLAHSNDGDGLDGEDSRRLADRLDEALNNGEADSYVRVVRAQCRANGLPEVLNLDDLREFRDFLRECGGFRIL